MESRSIRKCLLVLTALIAVWSGAILGCNSYQNGMEFSIKHLSQSYYKGADKLDILFVVDNSLGMLDEQEKLGTRIENFLQKLEGIQWQVGITTTDTSAHALFGLGGKLLRFSNGDQILTSDSPNYQELFLETVSRDEDIKICQDDPNISCPSRFPRPFKAITGAIEKRDTLNQGFFREGADLAVIIISDSDHSNVNDETSPEDVVNAFRAVWGFEKQFRVYGLIIEPNDSGCLENQSNQLNGTTDAAYGIQIADLALETLGKTGSVCLDDYSESLADVGNDARELVHSLSLENEPMASSVQITFEPAENAVSWNVEGALVQFDENLKPGTQLTIEYNSK